MEREKEIGQQLVWRIHTTDSAALLFCSEEHGQIWQRIHNTDLPSAYQPKWNWCSYCWMCGRRCYEAPDCVKGNCADNDWIMSHTGAAFAKPMGVLMRRVDGPDAYIPDAAYAVANRLRQRRVVKTAAGLARLVMDNKEEWIEPW